MKIPSLTLIFCLSFNVLLAATLGSASPNDQLKLGALFTLTGYGAMAGQSELHGVELAVEDINAAGGIKGKTIKLIQEDCQSDLKQTASAFLKLADSDGVLAVLGPNWAEFSEVAASLSGRTKTVVITASGYTPTLTSGRPYAFTLIESHKEILTGFASKIASGNYKRIALFINSSSYLESLHQALLELFEAKGVKLWKTFTLDPTSTDYRALLTQLSRDNTDALIAFLQEGAPLGSFYKQVRELKFKGKIFSANTLQFDQALMQNLNPAEGTVVFDYRPFDAKEFHDRYLKRYGSEPIPNAYKSYDSVFVLKDAIERCGESRDRLAECVRNVSLSGISGKIEFSSNQHIKLARQVSKLLEVRGGKLSELE